MTLKTDNYQIGLDSVTDSKNYLLDTDVTGALRIRRNSDGSGATILNITPDGETVARVKQIAAKTLSGTAVDWQPSSSDGPPSWAKKATLIFDVVSTSGTSVPIVQLGSTTIDIASYAEINLQIANGASPITSAAITSGFGLNGNSWSSAIIFSGKMEITYHSTGKWKCQALFNRTDSAIVMITSGDKTLAGVLDRIRLTTVGGTDTFDAGFVSVVYEG